MLISKLQQVTTLQKVKNNSKLIKIRMIMYIKLNKLIRYMIGHWILDSKTSRILDIRFRNLQKIRY